MCGRAKLPEDVSEIKLDLKIDFDEAADYRPRWNAAPTSQLPVVISNLRQRTLTLMRWGLVPAWAKDIKISYSTFNARAEDIANRPAFRSAWKAGRRCLVIADGYYEWRDSDKQPFAVALGNRGPMTFAGLWDIWHAPDGKPLKSFAIVTTEANEFLKPLHNRMPALLTPDCWPAWLGETKTTENALKRMLKSHPDAGTMTFWPVDRRVGNVRNDDPDLFAPLHEPLPARDVNGANRDNCNHPVG
jgi:putative SOS response-associated peptidase YedK